MNELPMKIICVNDKNKPSEIPSNKWISEGTIYTLIDVQILLSSQHVGFTLAEINLDESCFPYHYFEANRFEPVNEDETEAIEKELEEILNTPVVK